MMPPDYTILPRGAPPPGYPETIQPDVYCTKPDGSTYAERRQALIAHALRNPAPTNTKPVWHELLRVTGGAQPHEGVVEAALDFIAARRDCADFVAHSILRLLYQFSGAGSAFSPALLGRARQVLLDFKYFPDEPGQDSLCTWTENHYILFTSAAYLAGQLAPQAIFTNSGETGQEKMARNRPRLLRWLELRFRSGFSEWLSHVYYDEDLTALLALVDFCEDLEIQVKASQVIDLLCFEIALHSFQGVFGSTHGRSYEEVKKWAANEGTLAAAKLLFGTGVYSLYNSMSPAALALSGYRLPPVIAALASQPPAELLVRQRAGLRLTELEHWGLRPDNFEDGMHLLTLEAYLHPRTIANTLRMFDRCRWWENEFFSPFQPYRGLLRLLERTGGLPLLARVLERDACRNTREEVNLYTYRTPDAMLSTAQDYRPGYGGDQQHIWQATLAPDAVCFTTHPARLSGRSPAYWTGSGILPRAAQVRNVAVVIYNIEKIPALYVPTRLFFTHAWLPRERFDEVRQAGGWFFARKADGYLALCSQQPAFWNDQPPPGSAPPFWRLDPEDHGREIIAPGARNIWVCQVGRRAVDGSFDEFCQRIRAAPLELGDLQISYAAPGLGQLKFGWQGSLLLDGAPVALDQYPRFDCPYTQMAFGGDSLEIRHAGERLQLDFTTGLRTG